MAANTNEVEDRLVAVHISEDRMSARLLVSKDAPVESITREAVLEALKSARVLVDETVQKRVTSFLEQLAADGSGGEEFEVARGVPPKEGADEEFEWDGAFNRHEVDPDGDEAIDWYTYNSIITVNAGEVIGRLSELIPSSNGRDVHGEVLRPQKSAMPLELDKTIRRSDEDSAVVIADVAGRVVLRDRRLAIHEVLEVAGDVDFGVGNIDSVTDVCIRGTVHDRFEVTSQKSILVGNAVEAARLKAKEEVTVRGGIVSRHEGLVYCGGPVTAKFLSETEIHAGGDIRVSKEVMNCRVFTEGRLEVPRGALIGGLAYARGGAEIGTVGSDANVRTRLCLGIHPCTLAELHKLDEQCRAKLDFIERIRTTVKPLIANLKRLTADQKEQATELLFKADEAEAEVRKAVERRESLLAAGGNDIQARLDLSKMIHPGVTIQMGMRSASIHKELKGPVRIEERKVDNATEIVTVNQLSGSITVLPCVQLTVAEMLEDFQKDGQDMCGCTES